jgi:hypothetical protein
VFDDIKALTSYPCFDSWDALTDACKQPYGNIAFSHRDSLGISGLYYAVWAGMEAELEDPAPPAKA